MPVTIIAVATFTIIFIYYVIFGYLYSTDTWIFSINNIKKILQDNSAFDTTKYKDVLFRPKGFHQIPIYFPENGPTWKSASTNTINTDTPLPQCLYFSGDNADACLKNTNTLNPDPNLKCTCLDVFGDPVQQNQ